MNLILTVRGAMDERTKRELNYPHVQIGIIFINIMEINKNFPTNL